MGLQRQIFSEDHEIFRRTVRKFLEDEMAPHHEKWENQGYVDREAWTRAGELGFLCMSMPEEFGGSDADRLYSAILMEETQRLNLTGLGFGLHNEIVAPYINHFGTETQKQAWLPKMVTGEAVGALAMTEPGAGSDVVSMSLNAEDKGDHYLLNGNKMWITNGPDADVLVVYAKTDRNAGSRGITAFLIEKSFDGFSTAQKLDKLGMRGSNTCELVFEDCKVPKDNILGGLNRGVAVLMSGLDYERVVLSGGPTGIMQACMDIVLPYIHERKQFGKAIGEFQLMQGKIADMYTTMNATKSYVYNVAQACDRGETTRKDAAGVILYAAEKATQMALEAIQCLGGNGYINEFSTGRLLRDAKLYEIGAGTSEIRRMLIGRELFNESK